MIPQKFSILTPLPLFACCGFCVWNWSWVLKKAFLVCGPRNTWWGPGSKLRVPRSQAQVNPGLPNGRHPWRALVAFNCLPPPPLPISSAP